MDDVLDVRNVQASSGNVGGDQQRIFLGRESLHVLQSLALRHGSVERKWITLQHDEERVDATNATDAVAEYDRPPRILLQEVEEVHVFLLKSAVEPEGRRKDECSEYD